MTALARQNTLFVSEDWIRIYEAIQNVDFRAYDFDNLVAALVNHLRDNFPEEFNDWISSSEFIMKIEVLAWLSQNIAFRVDLNTRENFLATAERRDSLIRLAQNISYKVNRVRSATGQVRIERIRTNQALFDSNNTALQDREVIWSDPKNEDFFEQFVLILNAAFTTRAQFGRPTARFVDGQNKIEQYVFNTAAPTSGTFPFQTSVNGVSLPFDITNSRLNDTTGVLEELAPNPENAFNAFFKQDGRGLSSIGSGFFLPVKQGSLAFQDEQFDEAIPVRIVEINAQNINRDDFFVQELDAQGNVIFDWEQVDTVFGESVTFNVQEENNDRVFELDTLLNDRVRIRFGDGKFGAIPVGRFRFWYRTANPQPQLIQPADINNQTFTLPYVANGQVFFLTITFSLKETIANAASSESNFDIRTRANRVFYTQNRMITGRDYNSFFLRDNAIRKVKTVNRTFAGHSRFAKLNDPTGLYQNLKIVAEDGRLFEEDTIANQLVTADIQLLTVEELVDKIVKPLLKKADKTLLYFNKYPEKFFPAIPELRWTETAIIAGQSRGNITDNGTPVAVGDTASGNLVFVDTDAVIRIDTPAGDLVFVDRIIGDGTAPDGIILGKTIPDGSKVVSVVPAFRDTINGTEQFALEEQLEMKLDVGLSFDQDTESYLIVTFDNLDKTSPFSLLNQGDTSGAGLDASWMIMLEFVPGGTEEDKWRVTDRGLGLFFESARENDFFFVNSEPVVDPETGEVVNDTITLLECNESRDSLRRRRLPGVPGLSCPLFCLEFLGDGATTDFKTQESPLNPATVVTIDTVLQILNFDYVIVSSVSGDIIRFVNPPAVGAQILACISTELVNSFPTVGVFLGDDVTAEFDLGVQIANPNNILSFIDGVMQNSSLDFGVGVIGTNASIVYGVPLSTGSQGVAYTLGGVDSPIWTKFNFVGDGATTIFAFSTFDQTEDTILVAWDGIVQDPDTYTVATVLSGTEITFTTAPPLGVKVRIISAGTPAFVQSQMFRFPTDGIQQTFTLTGLTAISAETAMVFIDGVLQDGTWSTSSVWSPAGNAVFFTVAPAASQVVEVFAVLGAVGTVLEFDPDDLLPDAGTPFNLGNIAVSSCDVNYLGEEVNLFVADVLRHDDGFVNANGVLVTPADDDRSGFFDNPFVFRDIVLQDGFTDLVLWRKVEELGFTINDPINQLTSPKGTYGLSSQGNVAVGDSLAVGVSNGDIHLDVFTNTWLIANSTLNMWEAALDQTQFKSEIGRDHLKFIWKHFAPDAFRIDPSVSNVMDAYILTSTFDDAFRTFLSNNDPISESPVEPTPESLRIQFAEFEQFKAISDAIIFHPARYKLLFGQQAVTELRGIFKLVQTPGSLISENDLKLRTLAAIDEFFDVNNFDFGETFFFTELIAFIHQQLAPEVQSVVITPTENDQAFGRLFQVRSEPDELFISSASPEDIEVVTSLTDEELRIGAFI